MHSQKDIHSQAFRIAQAEFDRLGDSQELIKKLAIELELYSKNLTGILQPPFLPESHKQEFWSHNENRGGIVSGKQLIRQFTPEIQGRIGQFELAVSGWARCSEDI